MSSCRKTFAIVVLLLICHTIVLSTVHLRADSVLHVTLMLMEGSLPDNPASTRLPAAGCRWPETQRPVSSPTKISRPGGTCGSESSMSEEIQARRIRPRKWNECGRKEAVWRLERPLVLQTAAPAPPLLESGRFPASPAQPKHQHGRTTTGIEMPAPHGLNNASAFIAWILRDQVPPNRLGSASHPPRGYVLLRPCPIHPSIQQALPRTQKTDRLLASASMKYIVGERTQAEPIVTRHSRFSVRLPQLDTILTRHHHLLRL